MAAPMPPSLFSAQTLGSASLLLSIAVACWLGISLRASKQAAPFWHAQTVLVAITLSAGLVALFQTPERVMPPLAGVWAGLVSAWYWLPRAGAPRSALGASALGVASLSGIGLLWEGTAAANAAIGWLAGSACLAILGHLTPSGKQLDGVWALIAAGGALAAWCDKIYPQSHLGWPFAAGLTLLASGLWAVPSLPTGRHLILLATLWGLGAAWWILGVFHLPEAWLIAAAVPLLLAGWALWRPRPEKGVALLGLLAGGAVLIIENRVAGVAAMAVGGIALAATIGGAAHSSVHRAVVTWLMAVFASRAWLQLFFERVEFTHYGVDVTHPYATAGLMLGALLPAAWLLRPPAAGIITRLGLGVGMVFIPATLGYLLHIEALAAAWMGALVGGFVLYGANAEANEVADASSRANLGMTPAVLLSFSGLSLLVAPWLVAALDATRSARMMVLLALSVGLIIWWIVAARESADVPETQNARADT
ncbi:MAG: hypothetical protein VKN33_04685 [Candidatus Sericytochromatia bacterium]|nr:hypothetical protein [Candidatus Sericytochromatia bacterium]